MSHTLYIYLLQGACDVTVPNDFEEYSCYHVMSQTLYISQIILTCDVTGTEVTFVSHLYKVGPTSKTLGRRCTHVIEMFAFAVKLCI